MTKEEISNSVIKKAIYINDKWKVSIELNDVLYGFRIKSTSDITNSELSDLIYKELLITDIITKPTTGVLVSKDDIIGTKPTETIVK